MQMTRAQYDQALDFATRPLEDQVERLTECLRRRDAEIKRLRAAIHGIAPWLSASLTDHEHDGKGEYEKACNAVFEVDTP